MPALMMHVVNSSLTVTRTVTDTNAFDNNRASARVAVDGSGNARIVVYTHNTGPAAGYTTDLHLFPIAYVYSCATSDTAFNRLGAIPYVKEATLPWYNSTTGRWYVGLMSFRGGTGLVNVSVARAGVSNFVTDITASVVTTTPKRFRPAAVIGEYVPDSAYTQSHDQYGYFRDNKSPAHKPVVSSYDTYIGYGQIATYGLRQYGVAKLKLYDQSATHVASNVYSGGYLGRYDGYQPYGLGFVCQPSIHVADEQTGTLATGSYSYIAVHSFLDREGNLNYSRCSEPIVVAVANNLGKLKVDVSVPAISSFDGPMNVSLFRTTVGGTQYYLVESRNVATSSSVNGIAQEVIETFTDSLADTALASRTLLYRAPGTSGTALDRANPLSAKHVVKHKDRYFYAHNNSVYFSSFDVDGECPWFSPGLSLDVIGGSGYITGLASMDGTLVVFKKDAVWVIDGDGPPENGGSGSEFSIPRKIHTPYGCTDPRSIVEIPDGIVYRSSRGIELLTRTYKNQWMGERVQQTVDSYKYVGGATFDKTNGRLYMTLSNSLDTDGGHLRSANGVTLVYDVVSNVWVKFYHTTTYDYGKTLQDVLFANVTPTGNTKPSAIVAIDHGAMVFAELETTYLDYSSNFVPWNLSTGWVRADSKQDRIRVTDCLFLGRRLSGFNLKCQYYKDYDRSTATTIKTFDATATNIVPVQLEFQPDKEGVQSMKFVLSSETPTNPTTLGSGQQVEINGITIRVGVRGGGAKLGSSQKG